MYQLSLNKTFFCLYVDLEKFFHVSDHVRNKRDRSYLHCPNQLWNDVLHKLPGTLKNNNQNTCEPLSVLVIFILHCFPFGMFQQFKFIPALELPLKVEQAILSSSVLLIPFSSSVHSLSAVAVLSLSPLSFNRDDWPILVSWLTSFLCFLSSDLFRFSLMECFLNFDIVVQPDAITRTRIQCQLTKITEWFSVGLCVLWLDLIICWYKAPFVSNNCELMPTSAFVKCEKSLCW